MKSIKQYVVAGGVFFSRFKILPANFSPLGSFGFFNQNFLLYFATIIIFDVFRSGFYPGFWFTYLGFLGYFVLGKIARNNKKKQIILLPIASLLFFLVSNFGVWFVWYPHTWQGFYKCYLLAVPFYRNTLLGDLLFGYGYLLLKTAHKNQFLSKLISLCQTQKLA